MASSSRRPYLSRSRRKAGFLRLIRRLSVYESLEARSLLSAAPTLNAQAYVALSLAESPAVKVDSARSLSSDLAPANSAPTADNLVVYTVEDAPVAGRVNASDADNDAVTYELVDPPTHGSVDLSNNGDFLYQPQSDFDGTDT